MSRYKAYPEYKDSGVAWLGRVPSQWTICRIKNTAMINPSKSEVRGITPNTEVSFIPMEAIGENGELDASRVKPISEVISGYSYVADGDVMIAKITPCFENGKGAIARNLLNGIGFATTEVINIRPTHPSDSAYYLYLLSTDPFRRLAEGAMYGAGGQKRVADSFVAEYHFSLPEISERTKIAAFLDHETAKIDALIDKQQRLIELLKEKRQAVISHAVTKGLNPNAPMKDSGVEWLGEVPAHWTLLRVKFVCSFTTSGPRGWSELVGETGSLFIQSGDLSDTLSVNFSASKRVQIGNDAEAKRTVLCNGDVVVCITGAKTGNVALCDVVPEDAYINQHLCLIRPTSIIASAFLAVQLKSSLGQTYFELSQYGLKQGLSLENVREAPVLVPPLSEQSAIVSYLNAEAEKFDVLSGKAQHSKELLQERRTALISAAVTGKIDLRDWQAAA